MPVTADAVITTAEFTIPATDIANKQTMSTSVVANEDYKVECTTYDNTSAYINWQLKNVSTAANDKAIGALTKYTDGYAITCSATWNNLLSPTTKPVGFCMHAAGKGASCFMWDNDTDVYTGKQKNKWISEADWAQGNAVPTVVDFDTMYATAKWDVAADDTNGFNKNWTCTTPTKGSTSASTVCSRYYPKPTADNTYTDDFRFAPKVETGAVNPTPPVYTMYFYSATRTTKTMQGTGTVVTLKNATALAATISGALATAVLI